MILDIKHWILSHLIWVVAVAIGLVAFHSWSAEHDARMQAEAKVKADEAQVQVLQTNIAQNNQAIAGLQEQMNVRDAAAAKQIASLTSLVSKVQTAAQAGQALPQVVNLPVPPVVQPDSSVVIPAPDVLPLFQQLAQGKQDAISVVQLTADLVSEKSIDAADKSTIADMGKQLALKDDEIKALKKKPSFWKRVGSTLKIVGIGIGIGIVVAKYL